MIEYWALGFAIAFTVVLWAVDNYGFPGSSAMSRQPEEKPKMAMKPKPKPSSKPKPGYGGGCK